VPRILVVDDDASIRESIRLALATIGIETVPVESGERALEVFARAALDGAIVDLMMPGINGYETITALRARAPALPVIVMSGSLMQPGSGAPDLMRAASGLGGVAMLAKPFRLADLLAKARACFLDPPKAQPAA
jgi:CheY-like chemotaxis protein